MPPDDSDDTLSQLRLRTFDDALGRRIVDTHIWAVREGLRGADAYDLFDGYCQRLVDPRNAAVAGAQPRWRRCTRNGTATATLGGATSTPSSPNNTPTAASKRQTGWTAPSNHLIVRAEGGEENSVDAQASGTGPGPARLSRFFEEFFADGGTDYVAHIFRLRQERRPLAGRGRRLFLRDRSERRLQRRRYDARASDPARACRSR